MTKQEKVLETARAYLNKTERKNTKELSALVGVDVLKTPWCAAFVNAILEMNNIRGTGSNLARSFLKWGVKTTTPKQGDIVVFTRGNSNWMGHVAFVLDVGTFNVTCLGGNQGDSVSIAKYDTDSVLGFRTYE